MGFSFNDPNNSATAQTPVTIGETITKTSTAADLVSPDEHLAEKQYVVDTFHNKVGVNTERFQTVAKDLLGMAEGTRLKVTYYKVHEAETNVKGRPDGVEGGLHDVHKSVLKIHGFELIFSGPLTYEHNTEENASVLSGEAYTYPGFQPEIGDCFVMEIDTGKFAKMEVNQQPTRMSIRAATYTKIAFTMTDYMDAEQNRALENGVVDEAWFDKQRFLHEPGALLLHDEYVEIQYMDKQRARMVNYYNSKFLDKTLMYSYMRPDNVYDPYVTEFMKSVLDFNESHYLATQLFKAAPFIDTDMWHAIMDPDIPLEAVPTSSTTKVHTLGSKSVLANSLINKYYLEWVESQSLQDWIDDQIAASKTGYTVVPITSFPYTDTYELTKDTVFQHDKTYYIKETTTSGTTTTTTYSEITVTTYGYIEENKIYEKVRKYRYDASKVYYLYKEGKFVTFNTSNLVPDPQETYYLKNETTSTTTTTTTTTTTSSTGTIPANSSATTITSSEYDSQLGDLLLHLHPHYTECPLLTGGEALSSGVGDGITYIIGDGDHATLLLKFLMTREIDVELLRKCIENVWKQTKIYQFYRMPIYIFLARMTVDYIHHTSGIYEP